MHSSAAPPQNLGEINDRGQKGCLKKLCKVKSSLSKYDKAKPVNVGRRVEQRSNIKQKWQAGKGEKAEAAVKVTVSKQAFL